MILLFILVWAMAAGWIANMILGGGSRPDSWGPLLAAGFVGSFVGGLTASLLVDGDLDLHASGFLGTIFGAVIVLAIYRAVSQRQG